tara:strand:+ start:164 stop:415 length:252 start_codon:yes stop_codon:yes gene_type:complete
MTKTQKAPTTEATKQAIISQLENAKPTLKTSDYYGLYLNKGFMTLDFWIDFVGEKEAREHLQIMTKTNEAFQIFAACEDSKIK